MNFIKYCHVICYLACTTKGWRSRGSTYSDLNPDSDIYINHVTLGKFLNNLVHSKLKYRQHITGSLFLLREKYR